MFATNVFPVVAQPFLVLFSWQNNIWQKASLSIRDSFTVIYEEQNARV